MHGTPSPAVIGGAAGVEAAGVLLAVVDAPFDEPGPA